MELASVAILGRSQSCAELDPSARHSSANTRAAFVNHNSDTRRCRSSAASRGDTTANRLTPALHPQNPDPVIALSAASSCSQIRSKVFPTHPLGLQIAQRITTKGIPVRDPAHDLAAANFNRHAVCSQSGHQL
jgi:hypothetical protein